MNKNRNWVSYIGTSKTHLTRISPPPKIAQFCTLGDNNAKNMSSQEAELSEWRTRHRGFYRPRLWPGKNEGGARGRKLTRVHLLLIDKFFMQYPASTCQLFCLFSMGGPEPVLGFGVSGFGVLGFGVLGFGRGLSLVREMNATFPCCGCGLAWSQDTCVVCASSIYFRMQNADTTPSSMYTSICLLGFGKALLWFLIFFESSHSQRSSNDPMMMQNSAMLILWTHIADTTHTLCAEILMGAVLFSFIFSNLIFVHCFELRMVWLCCSLSSAFGLPFPKSVVASNLIIDMFSISFSRCSASKYLPMICRFSREVVIVFCGVLIWPESA